MKNTQKLTVCGSKKTGYEGYEEYKSRSKYVEYNFFGSKHPKLVFTPRKSFRARQRRARAILGAAGALRVRLD